MTDRRPCDWRADAECARAGITPHLDPWYTLDPDLEHLAVAICKGCPVKVECLREGMTDEHGVWGGWRPDERDRLRPMLAKCTTREARDYVLTHAAQAGPHALGIATPARRR